MNKPICAIDLETKGLIHHAKPPEIICFSWASDESTGVAQWGEEGIRLLNKLIEKFTIVFHNSSFDNAVLFLSGVVVSDYHDTQLMSYVLEPEAMHFHTLRHWGSVLGQSKLEKPWVDDYPTEFTEEVKDYCRVDSEITLKLYYHLKGLLEADPKAWEYYNTIELPFSLVIQEMERTGMFMDVDEMASIDLAIQDEMTPLWEEFRKFEGLCPGKMFTYKKEHPELVPPNHEFIKIVEGEWFYREYIPFNPASNAHKIYVLKRVAGWEPTEKTKTGEAKVSQDVLELIAHPFADALVSYSKLNKIQTSFIEPFATFIDDNHVMRGNFNQSVTITGRLSSSSPNMQNLPARGELGKKIRNLITVPDDSISLFNGDLSNIEIRVFAWMLAVYLDEMSLAEAFIAGKDIHSSNAETWGVERGHAKTLMFAILYGAQAALIAKKLKKPVREADVLIARLNASMPAVQALKEEVWESARENDGVLHTILGHRLVYPDVCSKNKWKKLKAERQIFNAYIQGSSADIFKSLTLDAMPIIVSHDAQLSACVHDEALGYVPTANAPSLCKELTHQFSTSPLILPVPISADFHYGTKWGDVKSA